MRVWNRSRRDERGMTTVLVCVCLTGLFAAAVLSIDAGNMWQVRRNVITGTDATALSEASILARSGGISCSAGWQTAVTNNAASATPLSCTVFNSQTFEGGGYIAVDARMTAASRFGGVVGVGDTSPYSFSAARFGYPSAMKGLRPMGVCLDNPHIQEYLNGTPHGPEAQHVNGYPTSGVVHRIDWTKDAPGDCGLTTPGNWGWQDFDGQGNSANDLAKWILYGYDGTVGSGLDCNNDGIQGDMCPGDTGEGSGNPQACGSNKNENVGEALLCIMSSNNGTFDFPIPIYDGLSTCAVSGGTNNGQAGGGNNCVWNVVGFLGVRMWGYQITGAEKNRYFDFEFVSYVGNGVCCERSAGNTRVKVVQLCAVDHDTSGMTDAQRCDT